jgi:hypothetical protein
MNGIVLAVAVLALSSGAEPTVGPPHHALGPLTISFDLPDAIALPPVQRHFGEQVRQVWQQRPLRAVQASTPQRSSRTARVIGIVGGAALGWIVGAGIGFYATSDWDKDDDGTSGLRGMMIGAPIGATVGAILGWRLTR